MKRWKIAGLVLGIVTLGAWRLAEAGGAGVDIRGKITGVMKADEPYRKRGDLGAIRVEGKQEKDTQVDRASIKITGKTRLFLLEGKKRRPVGFDALKSGQIVEARFVGPVLETYPVQATAGEVVILRGK